MAYVEHTTQENWALVHQQHPHVTDEESTVQRSSKHAQGHHNGKVTRKWWCWDVSHHLTADPQVSTLWCISGHPFVVSFWAVWASLIAQLVNNPPAMQATPVQFLGREDPLEMDRLPTAVFLGFPCGSAGKESVCNEGDLGLIPGLGRCPGEGKSYPLQFSGLENSIDCIVHGVTKSQTRLSGFLFHLSGQSI